MPQDKRDSSMVDKSCESHSDIPDTWVNAE